MKIEDFLKIDYKKFVKERDEAFTDFVLHDKKEKVKAYCVKYSVPMPEDEKIYAAGVYKAVQVCQDIPENVKKLAAEKCRALGMDPYDLYNEDCYLRSKIVNKRRY